MAADSYDVPFKGSDDEVFDEGSSEIFDYIICGIYPVKDAKAALRYMSDERQFRGASTGHVIGTPDIGFMFPAFDNRSTNIYNALYYSRNVLEIHDEFIKGIFNVENIPIKVYYPPVEERVSHFRPLKDFTRISILNTVLVLYALLLYYPWKFLQSLTYRNIKDFIDTQIIHSKDSNIRMASAVGWGIFCGIIPIWGYQMAFAGLSAHFMKLNKIVALVFSNISIPPMIPFGSPPRRPPR